MTAPLPRPGLGLRIALPAGLVLLLIGFASLVWTPWPIDAVDITGALADPGIAHWLGTDQLGRDVLSLVMRSLLTSCVVAGVAIAIAAIFGILLGIGATRLRPLALFLRGLDRLFLGLPGIFLAMLLVGGLGSGGGVLMLALGLSGIPVFARAAYGIVSRLMARDFVAMGFLSGLTTAELWRRHILPDLARAMGATALGLLGPFIMLEAALSFVGLGAQPPAASFGLMLRDAQSMALAKPLLVIVPGLAIVLLAGLAATAQRELSRLVAPGLGGED